MGSSGDRNAEYIKDIEQAHREGRVNMWSKPPAPINKVPRNKLMATEQERNELTDRFTNIGADVDRERVATDKVTQMKLDETNDFGFTVESSAVLVYEDDRAERLRDMIMPLLNNLKSNPDKDIIRWPNRVEKINEFIRKMNDLVDGE